MKRTFLILSLLFIAGISSLFASINSITVLPVGSDSQKLEAESVNNPVFHIRINADGAGGALTSIAVKNTIDSWGYGSIAGEPGSIASGKVLVWYLPADSDTFNEVSAQYVTSLSVSSGTYWINTIASALSVVDGSGVWVTVDLPSFPLFGVVQMQSNGLTFASSSVNSTNEPAAPPVLMVTSSTPAKNLAVSHSSGSMQPYVSTSQDNVIACALSFLNDSGSTSAPLLINSLTITAMTALGLTLTPSSVFSSIKVIDADNGSNYGELSGTYVPTIQVPALVPVSISVPPGSTVTANVIIKITDNPASSGINFSLALGATTTVDAVDSFTNKTASVYASATDSFPMISNFATIQEKAASVSARFTDVIPPNINKGQTNITVIELAFDNPGLSSGAYAEVYNLKLRLKDSLSGPIVPNTLFSKISVTDQTGSIIYGFKTAAVLESAGNVINIALPNPIVVPAASSATVTVRADILASASSNNFKIGLDSAPDISARDKNSFYSAAVSAPSLPFYSALAILSSSFTVSHSALMPRTIYKGQQSMEIMSVNCAAPLAFGAGSILVKALSITAKNSASVDISFSDIFTSLNVAFPGQEVTIPAPSSSILYVEFPQPVTVTPSGISASVRGTVKTAPAGTSIMLLLQGPSSINAYQDNEPTRQIFITALTGDSFPMSSGTGFISGDVSSFSLTNYPNPFRMGSSTRFSYYLDAQSTVTIKIFDLTGAYIRVLADNADRPAGPDHGEDTWDGKDNSGRYVLAGTYIARFEVKTASSVKKYSRKVTFIK